VSYFSYGVSTTSRTLYETPALFPKVTICNANPFTTEYAAMFVKQVNQELYLNIDVFNKNEMNQLNITYKYTLIRDIFFSAINKMNSLPDMEKKKLSHPLEDLMQNCRFNAQACLTKHWHFMVGLL
jgi:hypothetical protein